MIEIYWSQHCDLQDWPFGFKGQFFQSDLHIFVSINSCEGILYEQSLTVSVFTAACTVCFQKIFSEHLNEQDEGAVSPMRCKKVLRSCFIKSSVTSPVQATAFKPSHKDSKHYYRNNGSLLSVCST